MTNPTAKDESTRWFCWGISAIKKFREDYACGDTTYYGISTNDCWWLNGKLIDGWATVGQNGERIRERIDFSHFRNCKDGEVDIYIDCDEGILKICVVGVVGQEKEVHISELNKSGNNDGWVPNFLFGYEGVQQRIRVAVIDAECYGKEIDIVWN